VIGGHENRTVPSDQCRPEEEAYPRVDEEIALEKRWSKFLAYMRKDGLVDEKDEKFLKDVWMESERRKMYVIDHSSDVMRISQPQDNGNYPELFKGVYQAIIQSYYVKLGCTNGPGLMCRAAVHNAVSQIRDMPANRLDNIMVGLGKIISKNPFLGIFRDVSSVLQYLSFLAASCGSKSKLGCIFAAGLALSEVKNIPEGSLDYLHFGLGAHVANGANALLAAPAALAAEMIGKVRGRRHRAKDTASAE